MKKLKTKGLFKYFLDGSILTRQFLVKQMPFVLFLTVLAVVYIGNRYRTEGMLRDIITLQKEIKELRSEYITIKTEIMYLQRKSEVKKRVKQNGLQLYESKHPPLKVTIKNKNL